MSILKAGNTGPEMKQLHWMTGVNKKVPWTDQPNWILKSTLQKIHDIYMAYIFLLVSSTVFYLLNCAKIGLDVLLLLVEHIFVIYRFFRHWQDNLA